MSNLLTVSRMKAWRACKRLHKHKYIDGWRTTSQSDPLRQGDVGHAGLEAWWKAPADRLAAAFAAMEGRGEDAYEQAAMEELLRGYDREWTPELDRYEVLFVERPFTLPLINPETGAPSRTWLLAGKIDGLLRERETGLAVLLEHKLTSESFADDAETYWLKLGMDAQVSQYYLGAESMGEIATGCLYDVLRRPQLRPGKATPEEDRQYTLPKFKQCPLCKKKGSSPAPHDVDGIICEEDPTGGPRRLCTDPGGRLYASMRDRDETPDEYRARVRADIEANPRKYFARRTIGRTDRDVIEYLGDVWVEARMMRDAELANVAPRCPENCHRYNRTCEYWALCAYGMDPADHPELFRRVDDVHPELVVQEVAP